MKNATITTPAENAFTQMLAKADSELSRLAAEERRIHLQLQADSAALQELGAAIAAHDTEKAIAQQTVDARRTALREAEARAQLAEGTLGKPGDIKNLEKLLKQAQQDQLIILDRIQKAEQAEERRRQALEEAIERNQRTLAHLAEKQEAMEATKVRVFAEQGEALYHAHLQELATLQDALATKEQEVQQAKEAIDDMGREALGSLSQWPALQAQLSEALPYDDITTHVLEAAIGLLDILLSSGHDVERFNSDLLRAAGIHWGTLENSLSWDVSACQDALYAARHSEPHVLRQKKTELSKLLDVYRTHKKGK